MKKVVVISDLHCGHRAGLTPPDYQWSGEWGEVQHELWYEYNDLISKIGQADVLLINGDTIDGPGKRAGGTEAVRMSSLEQTDMAVECIRPWLHDMTKIVASYGTPYHTSTSGEDFEKIVVDGIGGEIHSEPFIDIEGVIFGMKHFVSASSIPHGRGTALLRDMLWNIVWAAMNEQPKCDIVVRSHVHYTFETTQRGPHGKPMQGIITPALQAARTKFGGRYMSGVVDWGLVEYDVEDGEYQWKIHWKELKANKSEVIKIL